MLSKCVSTLVLDETKEESYMKYTLDCDMQDGLVFIDESYLSELNDDELLYEMDILLDSSGQSELIFPMRTGTS